MAIAIAASSFLNAALANVIPSDFRKLETNSCAKDTIAQVGDASKLSHAKRNLEASEFADIVSNVLGNTMRNDADTDASKRYLSADVAAELVANILGLVGVDGDAAAGVELGKRTISAEAALLLSAKVTSHVRRRKIINDNSITERGIEADALAQAFASLLGLVGAGAGAAADVDISKRNIDISDFAAFYARILGFLGVGAKTGAQVHVGKRELDAEVITKLFANILGLIGVDAGAAADLRISKKELDLDAAAELCANILGLIGIHIGAGADVSLGKRGIDASVAAEILAKICGLLGIDSKAVAALHIGTKELRPDQSAAIVASIVDVVSRATVDVTKRHLDANVAAELYAKICGLLGIDASAGAILHIGRRDDANVAERNLDASVAAKDFEQICGLLGVDAKALASLRIGMRSLQTEPEGVINIEGRQLDANFAEELYARIGGLFGISADAGAYLHVERRDVANNEVMNGILSIVGREGDITTKRDVVDNEVTTKIAATILNFVAKNDSSAIEKRNISASAAAIIAANILGIFGVSAEACTSLFVGYGLPENVCSSAASNCKSCESHKRGVDSDVAIDIISRILSFTDKDNVAAQVGEDNLKRELQELYGHDNFTASELAKRNISFDAAKEICISILGLIGVQAGGAASVHV